MLSTAFLEARFGLSFAKLPAAAIPFSAGGLEQSGLEAAELSSGMCKEEKVGTSSSCPFSLHLR